MTRHPVLAHLLSPVLPTCGAEARGRPSNETITIALSSQLVPDGLGYRAGLRVFRASAEGLLASQIRRRSLLVFSTSRDVPTRAQEPQSQSTPAPVCSTSIVSGGIRPLLRGVRIDAVSPLPAISLPPLCSASSYSHAELAVRATTAQDRKRELRGRDWAKGGCGGEEAKDGVPAACSDIRTSPMATRSYQRPTSRFGPLHSMLSSQHENDQRRSLRKRVDDGQADGKFTAAPITRLWGVRSLVLDLSTASTRKFLDPSRVDVLFVYVYKSRADVGKALKKRLLVVMWLPIMDEYWQTNFLLLFRGYPAKTPCIRNISTAKYLPQTPVKRATEILWFRC
ncbi:hypothetical protein C8R45DRAFT_932348 [Mycena sanguinolenta]|nr:hypothetical protein C8R45DRAFT_932348 [Mycena sanguinolenta]